MLFGDDGFGYCFAGWVAVAFSRYLDKCIERNSCGVDYLSRLLWAKACP